MKIFNEISLQDALDELFHTTVSINSKISTSGGSINDTSVIHLNNGETIFLKKNNSSFNGMFVAEAKGLQVMSEIKGAPRVPSVLAVIQNNDYQYLLMEAIESSDPTGDFWNNFGESFATMHKKEFPQFGFESDNFIGATEQKNQLENDWIHFYKEHRLGFQIQLAFNQKLISKSELRIFENFLNRLPDLIGKHKVFPSLLHGDLWSGNYMVDEIGEPVLIDPAVYYGDAEADLAMTMLFGRFPETFYQSYFSCFGQPEEGFDGRIEVYQLYHLLNHLNLFGQSYLTGCLDIVHKYS